MNTFSTPGLQHNYTEETYLSLVKANGLALKDVPDHMRTAKVWLAALHQNPKALNCFREEERNLLMCLVAVKQDAKLLKSVPDAMKIQLIHAVGIKSIIANNYFATKYFPKDAKLREEVNEALASVKYIAIAGPSKDAEVRDAHLTYADQKKQIASFLFKKSTTMQELMTLLDEVIKGSKNNDLHLTLIGHAAETVESLGGLNYKDIVKLCEQYPGIKHLQLIGCNVAKAKKPKEEIDMVHSYIEKMKIKNALHYGLVSTFRASNNNDFQQKCLKFCANNNLHGVYVLNKTESGDYQLFSMKYDEKSQTIIEKVKDIRKPLEIQNILENHKPIKFPTSDILLPIRQKDNLLTFKELMALRDLAYEGNRFEKTHSHYKKDKKTYPFLATIHAELEDLESSFLKKLADEIKRNKTITWDISIKGPTKLVHVDTVQRNFTITKTPLYDSKKYNQSLFYHPEMRMIDYHQLQKERQHAMQHLDADNHTQAKQLKVVVTRTGRALNSWEEFALKDLQTKGLTTKMLWDRNDGGHEFDDCHYFALRCLVRDRNLTIHAALSMIDGLSSAQARGIGNGLIREDVISLHNFWHLAAMEALKVDGLTAKMLLERNEGGHEFGHTHVWALKKLMRDGDVTIHAALTVIDGLSTTQADGIAGGLVRDDVINLHNFWHISALQVLKVKGLTAKMLLERNEGGHEFCDTHYWALRKLVLDRGFTVDHALATIDGLSYQEAADAVVNQDTVRKRMRT